jgi:transcriptional regulator of acetoin/glycerol metabolism
VQTRHIDEVIARTTNPLAASADAEVDDMIVRSWSRCVNDHGLDPTINQPARVLESSGLREHQEQSEAFLRVARAGMEQLFKRVSPLGYVLLLTDAQGITVDYIGNDAWDRELKRSGLCLGADWNESHAGTCAVGTCIVEQVPLTCHQVDHFDATHIGLTCTAAPLFDPSGDFMGILDISALTSPEAKQSQHLARHLTVMVGQMVEDANFIRHFRDRWILRLGADWALVDVSGDCMLAFDNEGMIVGANTGARRALMAYTSDNMPCGMVGRHLTDVFKASMDDIWRVARAGTTSHRTVLSTLRHELYYAMATPPRPGSQRPQRSLDHHAEPVVQPACPALDQLAGDDKQMSRLIDQAKRLVNKKVNILLHGETGTGKEVVARALHDSSNRSDKAFIAVNCASIPESLIESELFGYTAGSFTGGRSKGSRGLILQSHGGTLFLDEIGDMPLHLQTRLLRVLSEREVMPLGADKPLPVDLTVVAASHRDLRRLIADGVFREDLYYRLCGATLHLPSLRARTDKGYVIDRILRQEGEQMGVEAQVCDEAMEVLLHCSWPGNIRQLRNVLRYALAVCDEGLIEEQHLPQELQADGEEARFDQQVQREIDMSNGSAYVPGTSVAGARGLMHDAVQRGTQNMSPEAMTLMSTLRKHRWNITAVSGELDICRATVYRQMKRYNIIPPTHL